MRYFSMFSGIGGFELGIKNATRNSLHSKGGREEQPNTETRVGSCIGYSEIDKYAIKVYERQFNGHKNYGDATTIDTGQLPEAELVVGGFPCQTFSIAGKRAGFDDTRGTLFFDVARILRDKRPGHFVLENVKGLLSHDKGKTFQTILEILADLGYRVEWQVLNSKNHGVPQNRERVYFIGHLRGECRRQILPITGTAGGDIKVAGILNSETWQKRHDIIRRVHDPQGISPTIPTNAGGGVMNKITDQAKVRRLTPRECERLQGFPDDWTRFGEDETGLRVDISDSQRYKMCGNAVTVNVVQTIITAMIPCLEPEGVE